jgi:hypothetical protein
MAFMLSAAPATGGIERVAAWIPAETAGWYTWSIQAWALATLSAPSGITMLSVNDIDPSAGTTKRRLGLRSRMAAMSLDQAKAIQVEPSTRPVV